MKQINTRKRDILVFLFSLAIIHGSSFNILNEINYKDCIDCKSYTGIARGESEQSPIRRYRVLVPILAGAIDNIAGDALERVRPWTSTEDFSLSFSFLIVNNLLISLFALLTFRLAIYYVASPLAALLGLISLLSCRWTSYFAGLPLVDSLYLVTIAMALLGIRSGNRILIICSIFIGPWAKEAFIFFAPLIFIFAPIKRGRQLVYFMLSGILVFTFRYLLDKASGFAFADSFIADTSHFSQFTVSIKRIFSFHGLYELWSVPGFWILLYIPVFISKALRKRISSSVQSYIWWYLPIVLIQMLLSTDIARMFYLTLPVQVVLFALIIDELGLIQRIAAILPDKRTE